MDIHPRGTLREPADIAPGSLVRTEQTSPPLAMVASMEALLSESEIDRLIADHGPSLSQGEIGAGSLDAAVRRSQVALLRVEERSEWLFRRIWEAARGFNARFLDADIGGIEGNIQLARYDSSDRGYYNLHMDLGRLVPNRKISISVQLSRSEDYEGGDLELLFDNQPYKAARGKGTLIAFPSFVMHRVTPVTRGTRWSLVAWISGARWR